VKDLEKFAEQLNQFLTGGRCVSGRVSATQLENDLVFFDAAFYNPYLCCSVSFFPSSMEVDNSQDTFRTNEMLNGLSSVAGLSEFDVFAAPALPALTSEERIKEIDIDLGR